MRSSGSRHIWCIATHQCSILSRMAAEGLCFYRFLVRKQRGEIMAAQGKMFL